MLLELKCTKKDSNASVSLIPISRNLVWNHSTDHTREFSRVGCSPGSHLPYWAF